MTTHTEYDPTDDGVAFITAVLASASTDTISPKHWWPRAAAALEGSAASASDWPQMVSKALRKLQIDVPSQSTSQVIATLRARMDDPAIFETYRAFCQRDAAYIVAIARAQRAHERAAAQADTTTPTKAVTAAANQTGELF